MTKSNLALTRRQLKLLGLRFRFIGRAQVKRLSVIIRKNENIKHCIYGFCSDGAVLLVATDQRLLIIDKRFLYMNLDSFAYDKISDTEFSRGLLSASINIYMGPRKVCFKTYADARLRKLDDFIKQAREPYQTLAIMEGIGADNEQWSVPLELGRSTKFEQ